MRYQEARSEAMSLIKRLTPTLIALEDPQKAPLTPEDKQVISSDINRLQEVLGWVGFRMINGEVILPIHKRVQEAALRRPYKTLAVAVATFLLVLLATLHGGCGPAALVITKQILNVMPDGSYTASLTLKGQQAPRALEALQSYAQDQAARFQCTVSNVKLTGASESSNTLPGGEDDTPKVEASTSVNGTFSCAPAIKPAS